MPLARFMTALALALPFGSAASAQTPDDLPALRQHSLQLVNQARQADGLEPLQLTDRLNEIAQAHAEDMLERDYYSHVSPEGDDVMDRFLAAGGTTDSLVAENIANCRNCPAPPNEESVRRLHEGWMDSPEHRENILMSGLTGYGFGIAQSAAGTLYAVQDFSGPGTPRGLEAGAEAEPLEPAGQTELALSLVNDAREQNGAPALSADQTLVEAAEQIMPGDSPDLSLDNLGSMQSALPADSGFSSYQMIAGSCGGCGTEPTDADVRFFIDQWKENERYRATLLDPQFDAIGMAIVADGGGTKLAVAILAGE